MKANGNPWVIILAGGSGTRIGTLTVNEEGISVPKQFCRFRDQGSLLACTLERVKPLASRTRTIAMVAERHRSWWEQELRDLPAANVLSQREDQGTATAILLGLRRILEEDRSPVVVVMPSDHDVEDHEVFARSLAEASRAAERSPQQAVLLGITPDSPDPEYGWILAGDDEGDGTRPVLSFVEKPALSASRRLLRRGAMWNSFVFAATGTALQALFAAAQPELLSVSLQSLLSEALTPVRAARPPARILRRDFGRHVLQRAPQHLRMLPVPPCGWSDLGTPARLQAWLERHRESPYWTDRGHALPRRSAEVFELRRS